MPLPRRRRALSRRLDGRISLDRQTRKTILRAVALLARRTRRE